MTDAISDAGAIYAALRARMTDLVAGADGDLQVPATPAWTVREVIAHMAGNVSCIIDGRLDGVGTDPWTEEQVRERKGRSLSDVLAEWNDKAPQVEATVATWPRAMSRLLIADAGIHEQDLRGALQRPGARDGEPVALAFEGLGAGLGERIASAGLPALRVVTTHGSVTLGGDDAGVTVRGDRFELVRAFAGRRSAAQVRAFDWDADAAPYVAIFTPFTLRADDLVE